jgi:putative ATPase
LVAAEEAIYERPDDPMVCWDAPDLVALLEREGLAVTSDVREMSRDVQVTAAVLRRWFEGGDAGRLSYAGHLAARLSTDEVDAVRGAFERQLADRVVAWKSQVLYVVATRGAGKRRPRRKA